MSDLWIVVDGECQVGGALDALGADGAAVTALVVGDRQLAEETGQIAADVRWIDTGDALVEAWAAAAAAVVADAKPALVVGSTSPGGRALVGAIAARLASPLISNVTAARREADDVVVEQIDLAGRVIVTLRLPSPACLLIDPSEAEPSPHGGVAEITAIRATPGPVARLGVESAPVAASALRDAQRVVSVGMGLGSRSALGVVEQLAQALDAVIACSMPVAELGWLPRESCVGLSGQHIRPKLYLALGISGAPQHTAGIRGAKTVVAVNKDPGASIFRTAQYGIVGDLHEVVPELIKALGGELSVG